MAQETFAQIWNKVLLYAPGTPVPLAQQFVKNSYINARNAHDWNENFTEGEHTIAVEYGTGTATLTNGSSTVAVVGGTVTTDWINRQYSPGVNGYAPFYDISAVNTTNNTFTISPNYAGASITNASVFVAEFWVDFPSDLHALDDIRDSTRNWRLRRQYHQLNYLDRIDAKRTYSGTPILYVAGPDRVSGGVSIPRYEFWPRIPGGTKIVYRYVKKVPLVLGSDYPETELRAEVITWGALAELCLWPGTPDKPNPFFNIELHQNYKKLFDEGLQDSVMHDMDRAQRLITYAEDDRGYPADARFIQEHGLA